MAECKIAKKAVANKVAKKAVADDDNDDDEWVPDPLVRREFNISEMSMWRWDRDETLRALGWPPKIQIRGRNFRRRGQLNQFKAAMLADALKRHA
jgi:hypothetical protein